MPNRSSFARAYSRHCERTLHAPQTFLASLVEPPFSGKKASGSVCAHSASVCQPSSPSSSKSACVGNPIQTGCTGFSSGRRNSMGGSSSSSSAAAGSSPIKASWAARSAVACSSSDCFVGSLSCVYETLTGGGWMMLMLMVFARFLCAFVCLVLF